MAGGYYTALSGMRARMDALDRVASDIANASTAGYKTERGGTVQADRPSFGAVLQSAVDVVDGTPKIDLRAGALAPTGRSLDVAIEGRGFFVVDTPQGQRYTRNGHLVRSAEGLLATDEGDVLVGASGPIRIGTDAIEIDADGTVHSGKSAAGTLKIVDFDANAKLERDGGSRFRTAASPQAIENPSFASGALEQSNVSVVERVAELTEVSQGYQTLLRAVSVLMNDVDKGAITELGRK